MNINGLGVPAYPAGYRSKKAAAPAVSDSVGTDFASRISQTKTAYAYDTYQSENYKIVPDNENACFTIYNKDGERLGAFFYSDIKIRQDGTTGSQLLISEKGTAWYDAIAMDDELRTDLQNVMGIDALEVETLQGYTVKTHAGTGIQYLIKDGEEGRGGKVLLQNEEDVRTYEALAETYLNKYSSLIKDKTAAYIYADLEIRGLAQHTKDGIISMGYDGMFYHDGKESKNNWSIRFWGDTYQSVLEQIRQNREKMQELQPKAPFSDSRRITASFKMEEFRASQSEKGEAIYSYHTSRQQFEENKIETPVSEEMIDLLLVERDGTEKSKPANSALDTEQKQERNVWEQSFDQIGKNAPESVKKAWLDAAEVIGVDGMGISQNGKLTHISQLMVQRLTGELRGEKTDDILGSSVQSAIRAADNALYDLEHPLEGNCGKTPEQMESREKEKKFYQEFLRRLHLLG